MLFNVEIIGCLLADAAASIARAVNHQVREFQHSALKYIYIPKFREKKMFIIHTTKHRQHIRIGRNVSAKPIAYSGSWPNGFVKKNKSDCSLTIN